MRIVRKVIVWCVGFIAALAVIGALGVVIIGWDSMWNKIGGPADLGTVNFQTLTKTPNPNQALICPTGFCPAAEAEDQVDQISPLYALPVAELAQQILNSLTHEQNLERVDDRSDPLKMRFVQRTPKLRFPDTIRLEIIPMGDNQSSLALYSQSQIGKSDLGVNKERVDRWLKRLASFEVPAS